MSDNNLSQKKQKQYEEYVKAVTPVHSLPLNMCKAFFTGGVICVIGQVILNYADNLGLDKDTASSWCSLILILFSEHQELAVPEVLSLSPVLPIP